MPQTKDGPAGHGGRYYLNKYINLFINKNKVRGEPERPAVEPRRSFEFGGPAAAPRGMQTERASEVLLDVFGAEAEEERDAPERPAAKRAKRASARGPRFVKAPAGAAAEDGAGNTTLFERAEVIRLLPQIAAFFFALAAGTAGVTIGPADPLGGAGVVFYPFALALLCCGGRFVYAFAAGGLLSLLFIMRSVGAGPYFLVYALACAMSVALRIYEKRGSKGWPPIKIDFLPAETLIRLAGGTALSLVLALWCLLGAGDILYRVLAALCVVFAALLLIYVFTPLFGSESLRGPIAAGRGLYSAGLLIAAALVVYALRPFVWMGFSAGAVAAYIFIFFSASELDAASGCACGALCGVALCSPVTAGAFGAAGLAAGLFFDISPMAAVASAFIASNLIYGASAGAGALLGFMPNIVAAAVIFLPFTYLFGAASEKLVKRLFAPARADAGQGAPAMPLLGYSLLSRTRSQYAAELGKTFEELAGTVCEIAAKLRGPAKSEALAAVRTAAEETCGACEYSAQCGVRDAVRSAAVIGGCAAALRSGRLSDGGYAAAPGYVRSGCARWQTLADAIQAAYDAVAQRNIRDDRLGLIAEHYAVIGELFGKRDDAGLDAAAGNAVRRELNALNIPADAVAVTAGSEMGGRAVYLFGAERRACRAAGPALGSRLAACLSEGGAVRLSAPEYIEHGGYTTARFTEEPLISFTGCACLLAAGSDKLIVRDGAKIREPAAGDGSDAGSNGDTAAVFGGGRYGCALICDGMGTGKPAALASKLAGLLVEKLVPARAPKEAVLQLVNSVLLARRDECFSTIDLFEADTYTGSANFIKAGAAPSFIVRGTSIFKIQSTGVPAGIVERPDAEQTSFELQPYDWVVMVSDGVAPVGEDYAWLCELLGDVCNAENGESSVAKTVVAESNKRGPRAADDKSCVAIKINNR